MAKSPKVFPEGVEDASGREQKKLEKVKEERRRVENLPIEEFRAWHAKKLAEAISPADFEEIYDRELAHRERVEDTRYYGSNGKNKFANAQRYELETHETYEQKYLRWWQEMNDFRRQVEDKIDEEIVQEFDQDYKNPWSKILLEEKLYELPCHRYPLKIKAPEQCYWGEMRLNLGFRYLNHYGNKLTQWDIGEQEINNLIKTHEKRMDVQGELRPASLMHDQNSIIIRPGIRRHRTPSEQHINIGLFYHEHLGRFNRTIPWHGCMYPNEDFYKNYLSPYCKDEQKADPFEWAYRRMQVTTGFLVGMCALHDYPITHYKQQYEKMATHVCNSLPESLLPPRVLRMDPKRKALYQKTVDVMGENCPPETHLFILENAAVIEPAFLDDEETLKMLKKIPECLENGLVINRLSDLFEYAGQKIPREEALKFALQVTTDIFAGEKPWWFKENFDLCAVFDADCEECEIREQELKMPFSEKGKTLISEIAANAGFAFSYAVATYKKNGYRLSLIPGISEKKAIEITCEITKNYGIGNIPRAGNVIENALACVQEVPEAQVAQALESFLNHAHVVQPSCELIGKMQGEDASLSLPGISQIIINRMNSANMKKETPFDDISLNPGHIARAMQVLNQPLAQRALTEPLLAAPFDKRRLLINHLEKSRLLLPVFAGGENSQQQNEDTGNDNTPYNSIFQLYEAIKEVCGYLDPELLKVYCALIAHKLPQPFNPPPALLYFLKKFLEIPNPEEVQAINDWLFAEREDHQIRAEAAQRSRTAKINRLLIVTNLLDAELLGLIGHAELYSIMNWIVEERNIENPRKTIDIYGNEYDSDEREAEAEKKQLWLHRLNQTEKGMALIIGINILTTIKLISPLNVRELLHQHIAKWQKNEVTHPLPALSAAQLLIDGNYEQILRTMKKMSQIQAFDIRAWHQAYDTSQNYEEKCRLIDILFTCIEAFNKSLERFDQSEKELFDITQGGNFEISEEHIKRIYEGLIIDLKVIWKNQEFIDEMFLKNFVMQELKILYWMRIFSSTEQAISQIKTSEILDQYSEKGKNSVEIIDKACNIIRANRSSIASIASVVARTGLMEKVNVPAHNMLLAGSSISESSLKSGLKSADYVTVSEKIYQAGDNLKQQLIELSAQIRNELLMYRLNAVGLFPVGGKVHFLHQVKKSNFQIFNKFVGFDQTDFHLDRASEAIILPAKPSSQELIILLEAMSLAGLIDAQYPELQIGAPVRLSPADVAMLATSMIFTSEQCIEYDEKAFCTNQDHATGARMMAYDDGGDNILFPFMQFVMQQGRTDMLGRTSLNDITLYQLYHSILAQSYQKSPGPFGKFAPEYRSLMSEILRKNNLEWTLTEPWIYLPHEDRQDNQASKRHYEAIKACTDAYFACHTSAQISGEEKGIIFQSRELFNELDKKVKEEQKILLANQKNCPDMELLLSI